VIPRHCRCNSLGYSSRINHFGRLCYRYLQKFGPVTYVKLFRDRGYGFLYMSNSVGAKAVKSYSIENKKSVKLPGSKYADVPAFFLAKSDQRREKPLCTVSSHDKFEIVFPRRELSLSNRKSDPKNNSTPSRSKGTYPPCAMAQSHNQSSRGYPRPVPYERSRLENEVWNVSHPFPYFPVFDNVGPFMTSLSTTTSGFHEVEMSTMAMYHSPYPPFFHCHTIDDMGYEASMIYYPYPLFCACTAPLIPTTKCESHVPDDKDDACHRKPQSSLYWK